MLTHTYCVLLHKFQDLFGVVHLDGVLCFIQLSFTLAQVVVEESEEKPKTPPSPPLCPLSRPITVDVGAWLLEDLSMTFSSWVEKAKEEKRRLSGQTPEEQRAEMLQAKYTRLWKARMHKCKHCRQGLPSLFTSLLIFSWGKFQNRQYLYV